MWCSAGVNFAHKGRLQSPERGLSVPSSEILISTALPPSHALRLRLLGRIELTRPDGTSLGSILTQPKRLALLAYLALAGDKGFLRRNVLLNVFWPEFDQERARSALRKALYFLRQSLGDDVIVARGDEEVGLAPDRFWCDAVAFEAAAEADGLDDAMDLYQGDLLTGFFVSGQPDFERWVDGERARLRLLAARTADELSDRAETNGDLEAAVRYAQTALELDTTSEPAFRRLAGHLYRRGDRAGLAHAYEQWRRRLDEVYGIQPAPETQEMVAALLDAQTTRAPREYATARVGQGESVAAPKVRRPRHRLAWAGVVAALAVLLAAAVFVRGAPELKPERVLVTVLENETGDPALDPMGRMAADWIAHGLMQAGTLEVIPATSSSVALAEIEKHGLRAIARETGAGTVISGRYYRENGKLSMQAQVTDVAEGRLLQTVGPITVPLDSMTIGAELLRQRVSVALAARFDWPAEWTELTRRSQPPTYDAYTEFVKGWDIFSRALFDGRQASRQAVDHFERAFALDSTFYLARLYAVLMYFDTGRFQRGDSVLNAVAHDLAQLAPVERLLLEHFQAVSAGDNERALRAVRQVNKVAPNSMPAGYVALAVATNRPREALAAHREFNRERGLLKAEELYWRWLSTARHMIGDHRRELKDARAGRVRQPELMGPLFVELRALAALGRTDEVERAIEQTLSLPKQDFTPGAVMLHTAAELRAHGHHKAAAHVLARAFAWHEARPPEERQALRETLARTYYDAKRWQEARTLFQELVTEQPDRGLRLGFSGAVAARLGDRAEAERVSAGLASLPNQRNASNTVWRAKIAAALGDQERALALLQQALTEGMRYDLWLHTDLDFEQLRRHPRFRELVEPKG